MRLSHLIAFAAAFGISAEVSRAESYTFKVNNKTDTKIVKLLVSEDGKSWAPFDLGGGIPAKSTGTLEWSESTNDQECEQHVKAVYADESESDPAKFDFCEEDLELDFQE